MNNKLTTQVGAYAALFTRMRIEVSCKKSPDKLAMAQGEALKTTTPYNQAATQALLDVAVHPMLKNKTDKLHQLVKILQNDDEIVLATDLIGRGFWFDQAQTIGSADAIALIMVNDWGLTSANTALIKADHLAKMGSADAALQSVRTALDESPGEFTGGNIIGGIAEGAASLLKNLVIIDDFIGTGEKVSKKIAWIRAHEVIEHNIYVATFVAQTDSKALIEPLTTSYFSAHWRPKAISDFFAQPLCQQKIVTMRAIEARFGNITPKDSLGYGQAEALYFPVGLNTPNSVFPIFWKKKHPLSSTFVPLLSRSAKS